MSGVRFVLIVGVATAFDVAASHLRQVPEVEGELPINDRYVLAATTDADGIHALVTDVGEVVAGRFGDDGRFVPVRTLDLSIRVAAGTSTGFAAFGGLGDTMVLDANGQVLHRGALPTPGDQIVVDVWLMWSAGNEVLAAGAVEDAQARSGLWVSRDGGFSWALSVARAGHPGAAAWTGERWMVAWNDVSEGLLIGVVEGATWSPVAVGPRFLQTAVSAAFAPSEGKLMVTDGRALAVHDVTAGWVDFGQPFGGAGVEVRVLDHVDGVWVAAGSRTSPEHPAALGVTWTSEDGGDWIESDPSGIPSGSYLHLSGRAATGAGYYIGEWPILTNAG